MNNNKTILAFIKENLGKDLNGNYNELGCAETVNNIFIEALGYKVGGGASTAKMLEALTGTVPNGRFVEVTRTQARAGDIVLSATGTGNGTIAHGHVGVLGENGVIYSNNSHKDMLDDHITAEEWKNYFARKGGFPVRYFRAVGNPLVIWKPKTILLPVIQSSQDPAKVSLTVKGLIVLVIGYFAQKYGVTISPEDTKLIQENIYLILPALATIWGVVRKFIK